MPIGSETEGHLDGPRCHHVNVPDDVCYVMFQDGEVAQTIDLGKTTRGEMILADLDADGRVIGIELVGLSKPCQQ
jgi:uncharacterized protein YuzE